MCRLVGIVSDNIERKSDKKYSVAPHIIMSLSAQSYAADESTGIAIEKNGEFIVETGIGTAMEVFNRFDSESHEGVTGIGHVACKTGEVQPIVIKRADQSIVLCSDATKDVSRAITQILSGSQNPEKAVKKAMLAIEAPFALLVLLPSGKIIAARNSGLMPLSFGKLVDGNKGFYVASQSGVLGLDAHFLHSISPGQMVVLSKTDYRGKTILANPDLTRCSQELLFWQRPGNCYGDRDTVVVRQSIGMKLGEKFRENVQIKDPGRYVAIPILEGGASIILGFGQTANIPFNPAGSVKSRYHKPSFMPPHMDLFPIESVVKGKRVVIIDEALISGGQLEVMAKRSLEFGAKEVHAVIGTMIEKTCPFGKEIIVENHKDAKEFVEDFNLASLTSLKPQEVLEVIGNPQQTYCTECLRV